MLSKALTYYHQQLGTSLGDGALTGSKSPTPQGSSDIFAELDDLRTMIDAFPASDVYGIYRDDIDTLKVLLETIVTLGDTVPHRYPGCLSQAQAIKLKAESILALMAVAPRGGLHASLPPGFFS